MYYIYILQNQNDKSFYIGYTSNLKRRLFEHQSGKGKANKWSDIDVAVITNKLKRNYDKNRFLLWDLRMDVDTRIEPHSFTEKDFADNCDPMVSEIRKTGIRVV